MKLLEVVILAAGRGSRLGFELPKALITLGSHDILLDHQLSQLNKIFDNLPISVVTGYKSELFSTYATSVNLLYNPHFDSTNTAESLSLALESVNEEVDVLWINGDVYFDEQAMTIVKARIENSQSCVGIQYGNPDEEAMKFSSDMRGNLIDISKNISNGEGEAVGINFVTSVDRPKLLSALRVVKDDDYFEKALQNLVSSKCISLGLIDLSNSFVREIDFVSDLELVNEHIKKVRSNPLWGG
jgi:choline kinase